MAIHSDSYDISSLDYVFDPYGLLGGDDHQNHVRFSASELLAGKTWGVVVNVTSDEFTGRLKAPWDDLPAGIQTFTDTTSGSLHVFLRDESKSIIGSMVIEDWKSSWPAAADLNNFDELLNHPLNLITFVTKESVITQKMRDYPYADSSALPAPTGELTDENNSFYLETFLNITSIDPQTYNVSYSLEDFTYTGSAYIDNIEPGPNPITFIGPNNIEGLWPDVISYKGLEGPIVVDYNKFKVTKSTYATMDDFKDFGSVIIDGTNLGDSFIGVHSDGYAHGLAGDDWFYDINSNSNIHTGLGADFVDSASSINDGSGDINVWMEIDAKWSSGYSVVNVGSENRTIGTDERIDIFGYAKIEDTIIGSQNANVHLRLKNWNEFITEQGIILALDDRFSNQHFEVDASEAGRLVNLSSISTSNANDIVDLTSINFSAGNKNLRVEAHAGNDVIWGSDANETMIGGDGNDKLFGGAGTNVLTGGAGADEFQFTMTSTDDNVTDFNAAEGDTLKFFNSGGASFDRSSVTANSAVDGINIEYSLNDQVQSLDISLGLSSISDLDELLNSIEII